MFFSGKEIKTDKNGYLINLSDWDEALALYIAEREKIELSGEHWLVIHFVRQFYLQYHTSPAIRMLVKAMSKEFGPERANSRYLFRLFPEGPALQATKIAGLPKPAKCL